MIEYTYGGVTFKTKKKVLEYVRKEIFNHYKSHKLISQEHFAFMQDLLRNHPRGDELIGVGLKHMWIQQNNPYPARGFWFGRIDGTKGHFSFRNCVMPPPTVREKFRRALRLIVRPATHQYKVMYFQDSPTMMCEVTGKEINWYNSDVDHTPPNTFQKIFDDFINEHKIDLDAVQYKSGPKIVGHQLCNTDVRDRWFTFHNDRAKLRVLSVEGNRLNGNKT
jgi:hypothetical protein